MSEAMTIPPLGEAPAKRTPIVYFIDDSATMREVIKIAFRRENIHVITCADAASALAQFEENRPDVVITDVIMPDQDGYSVCSRIKEHPEFSATPVVLMSGVVNKSVARACGRTLRLFKCSEQPFCAARSSCGTSQCRAPAARGADSSRICLAASTRRGVYSAPASATATRSSCIPRRPSAACPDCVRHTEASHRDCPP